MMATLEFTIETSGATDEELIASFLADERLIYGQFAKDAVQEARVNNGLDPGIKGDTETDTVNNSQVSTFPQEPELTDVLEAQFTLVSDILRYITENLERFSPIKSGRYQRSHRLYADGAQVDPERDQIPTAGEYVFINTQPYARKIERGLSKQSPEGVYQVVAAMAQRLFSGEATIVYTFRFPPDGPRRPRTRRGRFRPQRDLRNPAIVVTMNG